jgi:hypothetical protein
LDLRSLSPASEVGHHGSPPDKRSRTHEAARDDHAEREAADVGVERKARIACVLSDTALDGDEEAMPDSLCPRMVSRRHRFCVICVTRIWGY